MRGSDARGDEKPPPDAENADQISDFSAAGAARQSAQKRSAPEQIDSFARKTDGMTLGEIRVRGQVQLISANLGEINTQGTPPCAE